MVAEMQFATKYLIFAAAEVSHLKYNWSAATPRDRDALECFALTEALA